jgi:uncharacterized protein YqeY
VAEDPPSSLKERLAAELLEALKARQKVRLGALRLLSASVRNREVELRHAVSNDEFVEVVVREVKRRREAAEAYDRGGRPERASLEREEQEVLETYLPAPLPEDEVDALVEEALGSTGASGPGDLGRVMGVVMSKAKGRVDGRAVQAKVRARLDGP